jgi:hypothetical protein
VRHELPEPFTADVGGEYEVTVYFGSDFEASRRPFTWVDINQPAEFAIMFSQKEPFSRLSDIAFRLQHLLSLGTRRSAYPVTVQGHPGAELHPINQKLTKLLEACLMAEIGFEDDQIRKAVLGLR